MDQPSDSLVRRNLSLLWLAQFISKVGDQLFAVCGLFLVYNLVKSDAGGEFEAGIFEMARALPALLIGPFLGVLVDRHRRKRVMIATDVIRALLLCVVPLLYFSGVLEWWMMPLIGFGIYS